MDFENLEALAKEGAKMLILSNPHNPGGSVWTKDELLQMSIICLKYNVLIISDEIHCDLVFKPFKHTPVASLSQEISMQTIMDKSSYPLLWITGIAVTWFCAVGVGAFMGWIPM